MDVSQLLGSSTFVLKTKEIWLWVTFTLSFTLSLLSLQRQPPAVTCVSQIRFWGLFSVHMYICKQTGLPFRYNHPPRHTTAQKSMLRYQRNMTSSWNLPFPLHIYDPCWLFFIRSFMQYVWLMGISLNSSQVWFLANIHFWQLQQVGREICRFFPDG